MYGDIYSGGDLGSSSTNKAPGFPGGFDTTTNLCNATYRLVAAGTSTNFCTSATVYGTADSPFVKENATLYPMPTAANEYTTQIGSLDLEGLTLVAKTVGGKKFNKYGNEVVETGEVATLNLSEVLGVEECGKPCKVRLDGKVYHVRGSLNIDKDFLFLARDPDDPKATSSGTIIADDYITVESNLDYEVSNEIAKPSQLPSVAFIAGLDIKFPCHVSSVKGVFYSKSAIDILSNPPCDQQLNISGVMVAPVFNIQRSYAGNSGNLEPAVRIVNDGRLQVNPPPGLTSLADGINVQSAGQ
jgi:hypothetical protein